MAALVGSLLCLVFLAGCGAKPRTGPFDVPGAAPGSRSESVPVMVSGSGTATRTGVSDDEVNRAAAEIATSVVYFDFDRATVRPDASPAIERVAALLKRYPSIRISLRGHCDERGPYEYNYGLGERRARAVYGQLMGLGVPVYQVEMVTYGKLDPAVPGHTESAYWRNRRVEFAVLTPCY